MCKRNEKLSGLFTSSLYSAAYLHIHLIIEFKSSPASGVSATICVCALVACKRLKSVIELIWYEIRAATNKHTAKLAYCYTITLIDALLIELMI